MNISKETIAALKEQYHFIFSDENNRDSTPEKAVELDIFQCKVTGRRFRKTIKATKRETTLAYILSKLEGDTCSSFKNLTQELTKVLPDNFSAYPASYGFGLFCNYVTKEYYKKATQQVEDFLAARGLEYTCEYSDAMWVRRYKISKTAANLVRLGA